MGLGRVGVLYTGLLVLTNPYRSCSSVDRTGWLEERGP